MNKEQNDKIRAVFKIVYSNERMVALLLFGSLASFFIAALAPYIGSVMEDKIAPFYFYLFLIYFMYPAEEVKFKEAGYFIRFGIRRKDYIINSILIENGIDLIFSAITAINTFLLNDYDSFGYMGFVINKNLIGFIALTLINYVYLSFALSIGKILFIIIDKYIIKWLKGFPLFMIIYIMVAIFFNIKISVDIFNISKSYRIMLTIILVVVTNYLSYKSWLKKDIN